MFIIRAPDLFRETFGQGLIEKRFCLMETRELPPASPDVYQSHSKAGGRRGFDGRRFANVL